MVFLRLLIAGLCLSAPGGGGAMPEAPHPSDGPDVDLRVRIDEEKVVVTAIVNLALCDEMLDVFRETEEVLHPIEEPDHFEALEELIDEKSKIKVDGIVVDPTQREFEALPVETSLAFQFPKFGLLALTRIRVRYTYKLNSEPRSVGFEWGIYPVNLAIGPRETAPPLDIKSEWNVFGDAILVDLTHEEPGYTWHGDGKPRRKRFVIIAPPPAAPDHSWTAALLCGAALVLVFGAFCLVTTFRRKTVLALAGVLLLATVATAWNGLPFNRDGGARGIPEASETEEIFRALHANIYRAFDFAEEDKVYDALARSISGPHLDEIYNQVYRGLVLQDEGGAVSRVKKIEMLELDETERGETLVDGRPGFEVKARWRVTGSVFHWGHTHTRTNEYRARYRVVAFGNEWRIAGNEILGQERIPLPGDDPDVPR